MKKKETLLKIVIILSIILFICTIDDFLALHDIYKDYVSRSALQYLEIETSQMLPEWTNTKLEWTSVTISYWVRFICIILMIIALFSLKKYDVPTSKADE